jgi:hypothetical protein
MRNDPRTNARRKRRLTAKKRKRTGRHYVIPWRAFNEEDMRRFMSTPSVFLFPDPRR